MFPVPEVHTGTGNTILESFGDIVKRTSNEAKKWQQAVTDARNTIHWLEQRGDEKNKTIRKLKQQVKVLGGQL